MPGTSRVPLFAAMLLFSPIPVQVRALAAEPAEDALERLFPPGLRNAEVKRAPLDAARRAFLLKHGISKRAIDLYGDVYVKGYYSDHLRWGDVPLDDRGPIKIKYDTTGMRRLPPLPKSGHRGGEPPWLLTHARIFLVTVEHNGQVIPRIRPDRFLRRSV